MIINLPNGRTMDVPTICDNHPKCRDCPNYANDCDGDVDHDPTLLEDCPPEATPFTF